MLQHKLSVSAADTISDARTQAIIILSATAVILIVLTVLLLKRQSKKRKLLKYFKDQYHKVIRNEALEKALNNYCDRSDRGYWFVKIVEINSFSTKEHFFNMNQQVNVGRNFSYNQLHVFDEDADELQCRIYLFDNSVRLRCCSDKTLTVFQKKVSHQRAIKKKHNMTNAEELVLYTGDSVGFGGTRLVFSVYNNRLGVIY